MTYLYGIFLLVIFLAIVFYPDKREREMIKLDKKLDDLTMIDAYLEKMGRLIKKRKKVVDKVNKMNGS